MSFRLPRLYPIIDTEALRRREFSSITMAEALLEAGVQIVQFRHKDPWTEPMFQEAQEISKLVRSAKATFVVNDRADYAVLMGAGVHVGQDDMPPAAVRRVVGSAIIGFSTHNREQLIRAESEDVQYVALGPIFGTASKRNPDPVVGLSGLSALRPLTKKPLVAIGGITLTNARDVLANGADSLALIGGLIPDECSRERVRAMAEDWLRLLS